MAIGSTGGYGSARTYSAWDVHEAWRARRREAAQSYLSQSSAAASGFATAWNNQSQGSVTLATQMAVTRIQAAVKAKAAASVSLSV
jgi:hypothetical protein